ncbi:MAG: hypothetical protein JO316_05025 [Abitibacteriaceae bacterium]|nr:hypothetical protein [Abditibacteriaceae bacterium]
MISTRDLSLLPAIKQLKLLAQSLAMLDAIIEPEWEFRYYSFNAHWGREEAMASMRNGSGDAYFLLFSPAGAILKGFAHESVMSPYQHNPPRVWPGVLEAVPKVFSEFLAEPAFTISDTTFCIWRTDSDRTWQRGQIEFPDAKDPDGSADLSAVLDNKPITYQQWAENYYGRPVSLSAITHIYQHHALSQKIVKLLSSELSLSDVADDVKEIGY